jgi:aldose 1-epimerase
MHVNRFSLGLFLLVASLMSGCGSSDSGTNNEASSIPSIMKTPYGIAGGQDVYLYTLTNANGIIVRITNYGGIITQIWTPDREGKPGDIVLGYDSLDDYIRNNPYFGAIVGRYANRIAYGTFTINDTVYTLGKNNGNHHLHGGEKGFDKVVWAAEEISDSTSVGLQLSYLSKDGEEGYPGNLQVMVEYRLTNDNALITQISATTDKPCPVNICNHTYFNLSEAETSILGHILSIVAAEFTDVNSELIPTSILPPVAGTPMDFNTPHQIGSRIQQVTGGYDHNYVLDKTDKELSLAAILKDPATGREVKVYTTEPGVQFYSGNFLDGSIIGKKGKTYAKHHGLCLETQHFPDSPNQPGFPNTILYPGETYHSKTIYAFGTYH